jgi:hypothetical protein
LVLSAMVALIIGRVAPPTLGQPLEQLTALIPRRPGAELEGMACCPRESARGGACTRKSLQPPLTSAPTPAGAAQLSSCQDVLRRSARIASFAPSLWLRMPLRWCRLGARRTGSRHGPYSPNSEPTASEIGLGCRLLVACRCASHGPLPRKSRLRVKIGPDRRRGQ